MSNVPMYGFGGGSGTGGVLTVLAPAGHTVTISKDGKTKTKTANAAGEAVFKGLSAGAWTYVITDGTQTSQPQTADVAYETTVTASYFSATIHITYPAGAVCTVTDGITTLTAPDASGTWACVVPNADTWTAYLDSGAASTVTVTTNGETVTLDKWYLYNSGNEYDAATGGWIAEKLKGLTDTASEYTLTKNPDNISLYVKARGITAGKDGGGACIMTADPVSLSGYTTLQLNYDIIKPSSNLDMHCQIAVVPEGWTHFKDDAVIIANICDNGAKTAYDQFTNIDLSGAGFTDVRYYVLICLYNTSWGTWNTATINLKKLALW